LLLLLAVLGLVACGVPRGRGDDDDSANDDDIADDDDLSADDDDLSQDDDDVLADDDDATDDDDDQPPPTEGDSAVTSVWMVKYLDSVGDPYCQQAYEFVGDAEFSPFAVGGTCTICTGEFVLLNLTEVTTTHPDVTIPCVANSHFTVSENVGLTLTSTSTPGGDFLGDQAFIDRETAFAEGVTTSQKAGPTLLDLHTQWQENGYKLTHIGYIEAPPETSYFAAVGLPTVAVSPPGAPDYLPMWWYVTLAGTDTVMSGTYLMGSFWQINSNDPEGDYASVSFEGVLQATFTPAPAGR